MSRTDGTKMQTTIDPRHLEVFQFIQENEPVRKYKICQELGLYSGQVENSLMYLCSAGYLLWQDDAGYIGVFRVVEMDVAIEAAT